MTNKYNMKFKLTTLIDITDAQARKGDDIIKVNQQQNYLAALQTVSLRSNPTIKKSTCETTDVHIGNYKGVHKVWHLHLLPKAIVSTQRLKKLTNSINITVRHLI